MESMDSSFSGKPAYAHQIVLGIDDRLRLRDWIYVPYDNRNGSLRQARMEDCNV